MCNEGRASDASSFGSHSTPGMAAEALALTGGADPAGVRLGVHINGAIPLQTFLFAALAVADGVPMP